MTAVERFQSFIDTGWPKENILTWLKSLTDEQREEIRIHVSKMAEMALMMARLYGEVKQDDIDFQNVPKSMPGRISFLTE